MSQRNKKINNIIIYGCPSLLIAGILITIFLHYLPLTNYGSLFLTRSKNGFPPYNMNSCSVILSAKLVGPGHFVIDPLAGLSGARHLFVNYFINQTFYGIIEGGFTETSYGYSGLSIAYVKNYGWDHGGLQWKVPTRDCLQFIQCLHINTIRYNLSSLPYHFLFGPNSNSFMWWLFNQCSIKIIPAFAKYPFVGIDYFWAYAFRQKIF